VSKWGALVVLALAQFLMVLDQAVMNVSITQLVEDFGTNVPLVNMSLFKVAPLRAGVSSYLAQNTILLGIFFTLPLYLQIVLGFDALETGIRMLPISIAMFVTSASGSALAQRFAPRRIVQVGFTLLAAAFFMIQTIEPDLRGFAFGASLSLLGVGMGLIASQLGKVIQSSVGPEAEAKPAGCSTPHSSSARRSVRPSSGRSSSPRWPAPS
jgi:predicted MFS family arabinose efflux permease